MSVSPLDGMQNEVSRAAEASDLDGALTFRPMFGGVSAYIDGRVFASLSDVGLALKLAPDAQAELLAQEGAKRLQYEPDAPPSKQYIVVPPTLPEDHEAFAAWVRRSVAYVRALPAPKPKRPKSA